MGADDDLGRTREGQIVEVFKANLNVAETVTGVECLLSSEAHGRENTIPLKDVGVLHEEDLVLLHEPQKVVGCLGGLEGVLLGGVEPSRKKREQGGGKNLLTVVDEQVV